MNIDRLRGEIVAKYRTQNAFSEAIGWHKNKVSKLLCGKYKPDTDDVDAISVALDLSKDVFCEIFLPERSPNGEIKH